MKKYFILLGVVSLAIMMIRRRSAAIIPTKIIGERVTGHGRAALLGYPTVNIICSSYITPGMYLADSEFGGVVLMALGNKCECHYLTWDSKIDKLQWIALENIREIEAPEGSIIDIFNKGAKIVA